jgi:hypothetical protein
MQWTRSSPADRQARQIALPAVDEINDHPRSDDRREHRSHDAESECDGKALDGARAEEKEHERSNKRRDIGIGDCREGLVVAGSNARYRRVAVAQFLANTLEDQHIGVDGHADRENDAGDAGQGQCRLHE